MGTVSFDGQFGTMRKPQDFIVYPMQDSGPIIKIQSNNRMGQIHLETGALILSPAARGHAGFLWLQISVARKTAFLDVLPAEELQTLRQWIKATGGLLVGELFCYWLNKREAVETPEGYAWVVRSHQSKQKTTKLNGARNQTTLW